MPSNPPGLVPPSEEDVLRLRVKAELRKRMRGLRNTLPASASAARSARIVERLLGLEAFARAHAIALFWPMEGRHEVDLRPLDSLLRKAGTRVAYPAVDDGVLTFRFVSNAEAMEERGLGFREPPSHEPVAAPGELDAIIVPALAVDPRGHRIGYGAGYYDAALPPFAPPAAAIAVAFDFQLVAEVPQTAGDVAVAWIVTDGRSLAAT
jgi:5-formyltetrahydrofolate cyclo-ligase